MDTLTYDTPDGKNFLKLPRLRAVCLDLVKHASVDSYRTFKYNR